MKYIAYRIDTTAIDINRVVSGHFVRGQRSTDYDWPMLYKARSMEDAKDYIRKANVGAAPVYGPDGYGLDI